MAKKPYNASAKAAPIPIQIPDNIPYCKVMLIHINATAPTGNARRKPDKIPIRKVVMLNKKIKN
jgi:hypothetical protein